MLMRTNRKNANKEHFCNISGGVYDRKIAVMLLRFKHLTQKPLHYLQKKKKKIGIKTRNDTLRINFLTYTPQTTFCEIRGISYVTKFFFVFRNIRAIHCFQRNKLARYFSNAFEMVAKMNGIFGVERP